MKIEEKSVDSKQELLELINEGVNPLSYVKEEKDIDFISSSIIIEGNDEDTYYEETAEIVFKAIIYYVLYTDSEEKTLKRCKEITEMDVEGIKNIVIKEERANVLFKPLEIASERTQNEIMQKLRERLSKI